MPSLEMTVTQFLDSPHVYHLVDVRREDEYRLCHIPAITHVPLGTALVGFLETASPHKTYVFVCAHGSRSLQAAFLACDVGGLRGLSLKGGMKAWKDAGLEVVGEDG
jgi:rhodanese-related sulfurtransferase